MQESIVFLVRVQCRRKESSRSLSHLLMSFLYGTVAEKILFTSRHTVTAQSFHMYLTKFANRIVASCAFIAKKIEILYSTEHWPHAHPYSSVIG